MSAFFNEYGNLHHKPTQDLEMKFRDLLYDHFRDLFSAGITPVEFRAVAAELAETVQHCGVENLLIWQAQQRKEERHVNRTPPVVHS